MLHAKYNFHSECQNPIENKHKLAFEAIFLFNLQAPNPIMNYFLWSVIRILFTVNTTRSRWFMLGIIQYYYSIKVHFQEEAG